MKASDPTKCGSDVSPLITIEERQPETDNQQMVSRSCGRCLCTQVKYLYLKVYHISYWAIRYHYTVYFENTVLRVKIN
jgi:hypothetical protein